jgi:integrase
MNSTEGREEMVLRIYDAVPEFLAYTAARGLSEGTVRRHSVAAAAFAAACRKVKGPNATMGQVDHQCIVRFFQDMPGEQGYRNNNLETLRRFLEWAERFGYLRPGLTAARLLEGYRGKKAERQPKYYLEAAEFPAALEAAGSHHPADRAAVALALYVLARQSEIKTVRLCDLDMTKAEIRLYREKRDRWTTTGITPELHAELRFWLQAYAREAGYFHPATMVREHPGWLLVPSRGRGNMKLQPEKPVCVMERVAKRVLTDLGVQGTRQGKSADHLGEGMHTFRRSGARAFLKHLSEGSDGLGHQRALVQVSLMLDHEDLKQTIAYIGVDQERDELNDWLKGNSMYPSPEPDPAASVIPLRRFA